MFVGDTICAPACPAGGAISIIRLSGPDSLPVLDKLVHFRNGRAATTQEANTVRFGDFVAADGSVVDEVLVSIFRAPHSYTGEDSAEISCHASPFIIREIMSELVRAGVRAAGPGEFTRRAFVNGKMDLAQAEAVADVIAAESRSSHRVALNQLKGGYSKKLEIMRSKLLDITSLMELELDFSEEDVEFADRSSLKSLLAELIELVDGLASSFRLGNAVRNGVPVAIVGPVNAGKSTLLNALVGDERAIVSDVPGTTRDTVEETFVIGGHLFRFIDTAGIRETTETVEKLGIGRTFDKIEKAEIVLYVVDSSAEAVSSLTAAGGFAGGDVGDVDSLATVLTAEAGGSAAAGYSAEAGHSAAIEGSAVGPLAEARGSASAGHSAEDGGSASADSSAVDGVGNAGGSCVPGLEQEANEGGYGAVISGLYDVLSKVDLNSQKVILLLNKADVSGIYADHLRADSDKMVDNIFVNFLDSTVRSLECSKNQVECLPISAKTGSGLKELKEKLQMIQDSRIFESDTLVTNIRHFEALTKSSGLLKSALTSLTSGVPADLVSQDLREAAHHLGTITGQISTDEVLGNIFERFCIGK